MTSSIPPHAGQPVLTWGTPLASARAAMIMVHGRGASPRDIMGLAPLIATPDVACLAPAANGGTWYPLSFMAPLAQNEPGITSGIGVVHGLVDNIVAAGIAPDRIVLLGFSQGACLASTAAQRRARRYGGVVVFSGGLIGPPGIAWSTDGDFAGTPIFLGCSDRDPHIPEQRVRDSADHLTQMGADVTCRIYEGMGHLVIDDEIAWARTLVAGLGA